MPDNKQHPKLNIRDHAVKVRELRIEEAPFAANRNGDLQFVMKNHGALTRDTLLWLLELIPILVVPIPRKKLYRIIFGRRMFELAAFGLAPEDTIPVKLILEKLPEELIGKLYYLDTAVLTATHSLDLPYTALYELINQDKTSAGNTWTITTKAEFARVFDVSRSALSPEGKPRKKESE